MHVNVHVFTCMFYMHVNMHVYMHVNMHVTKHACYMHVFTCMSDFTGVYVNNLLHVYIICSLLNSYCHLIN